VVAVCLTFLSLLDCILKAIAAEGSQQAADSLYVSQPVSQNLERQLDVPLFDREDDGQLTEDSCSATGKNSHPLSGNLPRY